MSIAKKAPAFKGEFRGARYCYFVDSLTKQPCDKRVVWHTEQRPSVLTATYGSLVTAAVAVAEKTWIEAQTPAGAKLERYNAAMDIIQRASGLDPRTFAFAGFDWMTHYTEAGSVVNVLAALPVYVRHLVINNPQYESATPAHVREFDLYLKGKSAETAVTRGRAALDERRAHYAVLPVPVVRPSDLLCPDVLSADTFASWLLERAAACPLVVHAAPEANLVVSRVQGDVNQEATKAVGSQLLGDAYFMSPQPVFPSVEQSQHGAREDGKGTQGARGAPGGQDQR